MAFIGPAHIDILPWNNVKASSAAITRSQASTVLTGGQAFPTGGAVNNYMSWDVPLMAGTWTITLITPTNNNRGIITASLDGVDISPTVDLYSAGVNNVVFQWTGVSVTSGGVKEFKLRAGSKNASSSAYVNSAQLITFTNTDAPTQSFTCAGPSRFDIIPVGNWGYSAVNTPTRVQSSSSLNGGRLDMNGGSGGTVGWTVPLTKGTWTVDLLVRTDSAAGVLDASVDGTSIGTYDAYSAGAALNVAVSFTGVVVASSKFCTLRFTAPTKNGSSSANSIYLHHIALRKTA